MHPGRPSAPARYVLLYALLYGAFGTSSPFMPRFFESRGLSPEHIGLLFGLGTLLRLGAGPLAGRVADMLGALRAVLGLCLFAAALTALGLLRAESLAPLLAASLVHAVALAPTTTLTDALTVGAAAPRGVTRPRFEYGVVRGVASAAFVAGSLLAGQVLRATPLDAIVWMQAVLLVAATAAVPFVPALEATERERSEERAPLRGMLLLLRMPTFRRVVVIAALVLGSHAMHDGFAMMRWNAAGIGPPVASALWSEAVVAEIVVFLFVGPALLARTTPGTALALAALAGVVRWTVTAHTASLAALVCVQPLHGLTFALLHLTCMRLIAAIVPTDLAATAQAIYGVGATATSATLTVVSGRLYGAVGARSFLTMAVLCALALPLTRRVGVRGGTEPGVPPR